MVTPHILTRVYVRDADMDVESTKNENTVLYLLESVK